VRSSQRHARSLSTPWTRKSSERLTKRSLYGWTHESHETTRKGKRCVYKHQRDSYRASVPDYQVLWTAPVPAPEAASLMHFASSAAKRACALPRPSRHSRLPRYSAVSLRWGVSLFFERSGTNRTPMNNHQATALIRSGQQGRTGDNSTSATTAKARDVRVANIAAAKALADAVRTSLGPRGMDKMIEGARGDVLITNDGATILDRLGVQEPAAKMVSLITDLSNTETFRSLSVITPRTTANESLQRPCSGSNCEIV